MSTAVPRAKGASRRSAGIASKPTPLIQGLAADGFWIILCPLVALLVMQAIWRWSGFSDLAIYSVLFGFIVTGHHLPGWFRAFGEPAVYERYKSRLWVSLLAVPALVILPTAFGLGTAALMVAALFDLWHVALQQHGFGRIYAAKSGDTAPLSARLDLACVLTWYATAVAWSDAWMEGIARTLRKAGFPIFDHVTAQGWRLFQWILLAASAVLAVDYVRRAVAVWKERRILTPGKHWAHLVAFGVIAYSYRFPSWYRAQSVQNLFHALQYFFIVWIYGHLSIRREPARPARFYRAFFTRGQGIFLFAAAIAIYGIGALLLSSSGYRLTGVDAERTAQVIGSIGLASLLLHFYVDSFIWKVRSREVRTALAIADSRAASPAPTPAPIHEPWWRGGLHALAYFGIPVAFILAAGAHSREVPRRAELASLAREASLFSRSAMGHLLYGREALAAGDRGTARRELEISLKLAPAFEGPAGLLADMDRTEGNREAEIEHARAALRASPRDPALHYALGNALAAQRRLGDAEEQFLETIRLRPGFAGAQENLGVIYKWQGKLDLALPRFRRAHELDPDFSEAACNLAGAQAMLGQTDAALTTLAVYRARHPEDRVAADLERAIRQSAGQTPGR